MAEVDDIIMAHLGRKNRDKLRSKGQNKGVIAVSDSLKRSPETSEV